MTKSELSNMTKIVYKQIYLKENTHNVETKYKMSLREVILFTLGQSLKRLIGKAESYISYL